MQLAQLKKYSYPILLVIVSFLLFCLNYKSGTWLSGWDTLHPEMNFGVYWRRIFESVWQEHQGLGAVATQSHAAEIPRVFLMEILDIFFPLMMLRWLYMGAMLIAGPLGVYYLVKNLCNTYKTKNHELVAFSAGLFYLLNLGTLQNFYVPLEMFVTLYGFAGWLFLYFIKNIQSLNKKDFIIFAVLTFFSAPMAHTPTLWAIYFLFLNLFGLGFLLERRLNKKSVKDHLGRFILLISVTVLINLYWILPALYFIINQSQDVAAAKITRLVSEEGILNNQEYATIKDIAVLKGYLFNWRVHRGEGLFSPIFINWEDYYFSSKALVLGYIFFAVIVISFVASIIKKKLIPICLTAVFSIFFLLMDTPPLGFIYSFLQDNIFLFREAFRFPYTKFSIPLMLAYSVLFGFGLGYLGEFAKKFIPQKLIVIIFIIFSFSLVIYTLPAFEGELIGDINKVEIPEEYFDSFAYLNQYSDIRIATLPVNTLFGWTYYDWVKDNKLDGSYQGAGFTWFLSKNPILEREFDRWYPTNEDFYNEFQYAVYSENVEHLDYLLQKYDIDYLLFDKNVISSDTEGALFYDQISTLLSVSKNISLDKRYGQISLYKTSNYKEGFVEIPEKYQASESYDFSNLDSNKASSTYVTSYAVPGENSYPMVDDNTLANELANKGYLEIPLLSNDLSNTFIEVPSYFDSNELFPMSAQTYGTGQIDLKISHPSIESATGSTLYNAENKASVNLGNDEMLYINGYAVDPATEADINLIYDKGENPMVISREPVYSEDFEKHVYSAEPTDCAGGRGGFGKAYGARPGSVVLSAKDKNVCLEFKEGVGSILPVVYKVSFNYKNTNGSRPLFCLVNASDKECINNKYYHSPISSEEAAFYEGYFPITSSVSTNLTLILETEDKKDTQEAEFWNIKVELFEIKANVNVSNNFKSLKRNIPVKPADFPLKVNIPTSSLDEVYTPGNTAFSSTVRNCDNFNRGNVDRSLDNSDKGDYYLYTSVDAISCDLLSPNESDVRLGYLITFDSLNLAGKALDICVNGHEFEKCLISDRLAGNGPQSYILPPYKSSSTFSIGLGSQSIGRVATKNELYSIGVRHIPYTWLKDLNVKSAEPVSSTLSLKSNNKENLYKYSLELENSSGEVGLVVLRQSYEGNWALYDPNKCFMGVIGRFTCRPIGRHVLVDNWANGWLVSEPGSYIILFEPQYLQFLGYPFLALTALIGAIVFYRPKQV